MRNFDESGAPTEASITRAFSGAVHPLEVIESVASTLNHFEQPEWLIKRLVECRTLGQIFSDWNVGKSALAVDIACRVATGLDFASRKVCRGPVLYVATEGHRGLRRRFKGWQEINGHSIPSSLYQTRISLRLPDSDNEIKLKSAISYIESKHASPPLLVIIDTLAQTMVGEQNSTSDVDKFTSILRELFQNSAVMLLHHAGHMHKSRGRGASSLPAACDWEFRLEEFKESPDTENVIKYVRLVNTKQRDEESQNEISFSLIRVVLGEDEDGDEITTVVARHLLDFISKPPLTIRKGPEMTKALRCLDELTQEHEERLVTGGYSTAAAQVMTEDWRIRCVDSGIKPETFRKIKQRLQEGKEIRIDTRYVTRVQA